MNRIHVKEPAMARLQRLLAATDLSTPARHAAERAASVAKAAGAALDLVHVAEFSRVNELRRLVSSLPEDLAERIREQAQMLVGALAVSLRDRWGIDPGIHVATGPLLGTIEDTATELAADVLVLGARGASMLRHVMLGSTADRLVGNFSRPLLVVKRAPAADYRCVLVPVDFSARALPALQLARAVAPQARVVVMHAYEIPFEGKLIVAGMEETHLQEYRERAGAEAQQRMAALRQQAGIAQDEALEVLVHGAPAQRILEQEQERDCDLIVLGRRGQGRLQDILLGSVSRRVLAEAQADVLLLP
jgi:nucleotide-binding universal stress UspA family protein